MYYQVAGAAQMIALLKHRNHHDRSDTCIHAASTVFSIMQNRHGSAQSTPQQTIHPPTLPSSYPHRRDVSHRNITPNLTVTGHDLHESPSPERLVVHGVAVDPGDDLPRAFLSGANHARDFAGREIFLLVLLQSKRGHQGQLEPRNHG